jgi:Hypothetical protein (DUF2513)
MKRDMDLIRKLLLAVEASDSGIMTKNTVIEGFTEEQIGHHADLIAEAKLEVAYELRGDNIPTFFILRLTWPGHEFLEAARSESIWRKAVGTLKEKGIGMGFDVLKDLLVRLGRSALGLAADDPT